MSRETVRMVREGRRLPVVVGTEDDRDELLARIAVLELDLRIANRALSRLLAPKPWTEGTPWGYPGDEGEGLGYVPWVEDEDGDDCDE